MRRTPSAIIARLRAMEQKADALEHRLNEPVEHLREIRAQLAGLENEYPADPESMFLGEAVVSRKDVLACLDRAIRLLVL